MNKVNSLNDFQITQKNIHNTKRISHIKFGCFTRTKILKDVIADSSNIDDCGSNNFLKSLKIFEDL